MARKRRLQASLKDLIPIMRRIRMILFPLQEYPAIRQLCLDLCANGTFPFTRVPLSWVEFPPLMGRVKRVRGSRPVRSCRKHREYKLTNLIFSPQPRELRIINCPPKASLGVLSRSLSAENVVGGLFDLLVLGPYHTTISDLPHDPWRVSPRYTSPFHSQL